MQFQFGDQTFETENETAVGSRWIVDAVLIADQTLAKAAEVEELIPVRAVTSQACGIVGEHDADLAERDQRHQLLKAWTVGSAAAGAP